MNVLFHTLGCKVNQYETEAIKEMFLNNGHVSNEQITADAVIINSCTVTAESDRKTRQILSRFRRNYPNAVIVLTGCMVQAFPEKSKELEHADIVIGNKNIKKIVTLTENYVKDKIFDYEEHKNKDPYITPAISDFDERTRAYIKIEDGCDRFCSYCIIPYARGRVRSRKLDDIKSEATRLAQKGYKEVVLVGINLSAYGKGEDINICDAVETVCSVDGIKRVRLGSLEPDHITDDMLKRLSVLNKFCPQFHLSLQSGCSETLGRMNRHYDSNFYLDLVNRIRSVFPDAAITTDVMVGFAGETEQEFATSADFVKQVGFAKCHIFVYSRRTGTVAAALKNQVEKSEKLKRSKIMHSVAETSEKEFLSTQIGKVFPVLFETGCDSFATGFTPNYTKVLVKTDNYHTGEILDVKLTKAENDFCYGEIV